MTEEELKAAEVWAELPFSTEELAVILCVPIAKLRVALIDNDDPLGCAVKRGRLLAKAEYFKKVRVLSNQGSGPAQAAWKQLMDRIEQ